jgi:predicted porin
MKKSLLALAVLGAFAGTAQAQTNVTLYGIADVGATYSNVGNGVTWQEYSGGNAASRIGFKGSEDLGSGLKASFLLEQGFGVDNGSAANPSKAFSRLAYVGLGGNATGTVRLGRQNTVIKDMMGTIDPFSASGQANIHDFFLYGMDQRQDNLVTYISPNWNGFSAEAQWGFGEQAGQFHANRQWAGLLAYKNGPLDVQLAYRNKNVTDTALAVATATTSAGFTPDQAALPTVDVAADTPFNSDTKDAIIGATYDFNVAKLHGAYGDRRIGDAPVIGSQKIRSAMVGVTVPFGPHALRADYIHNQQRDIDNLNANIYAVSYTYSFSKRTTLYATYTGTSNGDAGIQGLGDFPVANPGNSANVVTVGVQHNF